MSDAPGNIACAEESERLERKQTDRDADSVLQATCALANDLGDSRRPGYLVLGVDKTGVAVGVDTSDEAIQRLVNRLTSTRILPNPSISVTPHTPGPRGVLLVRVDPYPVPPVVLVDGVAWVRVGATTRRATEADLVRLRERRPENAMPFDQRAVAAASVDDLNVVLLRKKYDEVAGTDAESGTFPAFENWLAQKEITRRTPAGWRPTGAGLLIHGLAPQMFVPGATVEFVRYGGMDFDAPVAARKTIIGTLPDQMDSLWAQLQAHLVEVPAGTDGIRSLYAPQYPLEALKELARNLLQHRLYEGTNAPGRVSWMEDRVVFNNPGARFGGASEGEFGAHSDYRNPTITRFLVETGHVERLGRGIRRVRAALEANKNPPLEVESDGFLTVTVWRRP
ncbi:MAG: putative DNA binding domain-containing protein [Planctomycetes bacterium]|nr:putative DNA binding domain-containing protein [Planctomycetota bacterium]